MKFKEPEPALEPSYVQDGLSIYHVTTKWGTVEVRWHSRLSRDELQDLVRIYLPSPTRRSALGALWI